MSIDHKVLGIPAILLFYLVFGKGYCICANLILIPHRVFLNYLNDFVVQNKPARVELNDVKMSAQMYADGL